jgi:peptidase E
MKMYLTSVASCLENIESFKNLINKDTRLVVLPFSYHKDYINCAEDIWNHFDRDVNNTNSIYWQCVRPFIDAGLNSDNITIINQYTDPHSYIKYKISRPNTIVYLPGGYPENIMANLYKYDLYKDIKHCYCLVGESAGSMVPYADFFVYKDRDYACYAKYKGLRIIYDVALLPHFDPANQDIVEACNKFSKARPKVKIYCVMDGGYVAYDKGKLTECHKTFVFKRRKTKNTKKTKGFVKYIN